MDLQQSIKYGDNVITDKCRAEPKKRIDNKTMFPLLFIAHNNWIMYYTIIVKYSDKCNKILLYG